MNRHFKESRGGTGHQNAHRSLIGVVRPSEYFITTVNTNEWRNHMFWANNNDGKKLREVITGRFGTTLVISKSTLHLRRFDARMKMQNRSSLIANPPVFIFL